MKELKNYFGNGLNYDYINFSDYFRSLSSEGRRQSLVSEKKFKEIKSQTGELLSEVIGEYTGHESTSVMKDTANDLFVSLLYSLDMALFTFESHEQALEYILENDVAGIYQKGQNIIKRCLFECVSLLVKAKKNRINYPDISYNSTLDGGIMTYLKKYDSKYFAHGTKRFFSYSTVNGCGGYRGILHTKKYVENLIIENDFVCGYGEELVQDICYGYCENNGVAYNDMGVNIYSLVFMNAVFAKIAGDDGIQVKKEDAKRISRLFKKLPEPEQRRIICNTAEEIFSDAYMHKSAFKLSGYAVNAINNNDMNKIMYIGELK